MVRYIIRAYFQSSSSMLFPGLARGARVLFSADGYAVSSCWYVRMIHSAGLVVLGVLKGMGNPWLFAPSSVAISIPSV
ncbi:hypothetical protein U1Q18_001045 [Sarracenia purpurea var. burkii]